MGGQFVKRGPEFWTEAREREFLEVRRRIGIADDDSVPEIDQIICADFEGDPYEEPSIRTLRIKAQIRR